MKLKEVERHIPFKFENYKVWLSVKRFLHNATCKGVTREIWFDLERTKNTYNIPIIEPILETIYDSELENISRKEDYK